MLLYHNHNIVEATQTKRNETVIGNFALSTQFLSADFILHIDFILTLCFSLVKCHFGGTVKQGALLYPEGDR